MLRPTDSLQEWLWCESWCSEASKQNAKTIDMCCSMLSRRKFPVRCVFFIWFFLWGDDEGSLLVGESRPHILNLHRYYVMFGVSIQMQLGML